MTAPAPGTPPDARARFTEDASAGAADAFRDVIVAFLARSGEGQGAVSPAADFADVARRFDEPIPPHGRPLAEVLARLERDVLAGVNRAVGRDLHVGRKRKRRSRRCWPRVPS